MAADIQNSDDVLHFMGSHPLDNDVRPFASAECSDHISLHKHKLLARRFTMFATSLEKKRPGSSPPNFDPERHFTMKVPIAFTQAFFIHLLDSSQGRIEAKVNHKTLLRHWRIFKRSLKLHADMDYTYHEDMGMRKWIVRYLAEHKGASQRARPKPRAPLPVVDDLQIFLWKYDGRLFRTERHRAQLSFLINVLFYKGARPGEIVESNAWIGSNEGLLYKDVQIRRVRIGCQSLVYAMRIALRNRKGGRGDADKTGVAL